MAKPELGIKRTCTGCGARFYDLARDPIVCPKCETVFDPAAQIKSGRSKAAAPAAAAAPKKPKAAPVVDDDAADDSTAVAGAANDDATTLADVDDDSEDEAVIEDVSELGEDKDDMFEVIDKVAVSDEDTP